MLKMEECRPNTRQGTPRPGTKKTRRGEHNGPKRSKGAPASEFCYIMRHQDEVSLWSGRVLDDGTHLYNEMNLFEYGITEDDLLDAIRLGEIDYFESMNTADPRYYPVSPHIEKKLKILDPY
ncbi:MAG: hypothetical protein APR55_08720 [Methanolinea sp. SDB]|nr:MAG: hypothetical protein APR55_08720 [Methanolinea sp. SDB]